MTRRAIVTATLLAGMVMLAAWWRLHSRHRVQVASPSGCMSGDGAPITSNSGANNEQALSPSSIQEHHLRERRRVAEPSTECGAVEDESPWPDTLPERPPVPSAHHRDETSIPRALVTAREWLASNSDSFMRRNAFRSLL